jgi:hypothetical protein
MVETTFLRKLKELLEEETGRKFVINAEPYMNIQWEISCVDRSFSEARIGGVCQYQDGSIQIYPPGKGEVGEVNIEFREHRGINYPLKEQLHHPENWERLRDRFPKTVAYLQGLKNLAERISREEGVRLEFWIDGDDFGYVALPQIKGDMSDEEKLSEIRRHLRAFLRYSREELALWRSLQGKPAQG